MSIVTMIVVLLLSLISSYLADVSIDRSYRVLSAVFLIISGILLFTFFALILDLLAY